MTRRNTRAAAVSQYALLLGLICMLALLAVSGTGRNLNLLFGSVSNNLSNSAAGAGATGGGGGTGEACAADSGSDPNFLASGAGANNTVRAIAAQSDGRLIVGGNFTTFNGGTRLYVARLNPDGALDTSFMSANAGASSSVNDVEIQPDGKVVIGGVFTAFDGTPRFRLARLNTDGTLDGGFTMSNGPDNVVNTIALQSDGKILIGGGFAYYNGTLRYGMARVNGDGSLDTGFMGAGHNGMSGTGALQDIAVQSDGKILIGGDFTSWDGATRTRIARTNANGTVDTGFQAGLAGANNTVQKILPLSSGQIYIGGNFTTVNGTARNRIARLNADGTLDASFASGSGTDGIIYAITRQTDDKLLIAGAFSLYRGNARANIARVNTDGSNDGSFLSSGSGGNSSIQAIGLQGDGRAVIGGTFTSYNGTTRGRLARLGCL